MKAKTIQTGFRLPAHLVADMDKLVADVEDRDKLGGPVNRSDVARSALEIGMKVLWARHGQQTNGGE